jgi:hypothetical protein
MNDTHPWPTGETRAAARRESDGGVPRREAVVPDRPAAAERALAS